MKNLLAITVLLVGSPAGVTASEAVGQRPYEMVWANRTEDDYPPAIDFESLDGWTVFAEDAEARVVRTREQQLWGRLRTGQRALASRPGHAPAGRQLAHGLDAVLQPQTGPCRRV